MTEAECIAYFNGLQRFTRRPGLERMLTLLERLGNPHKKIKAVHVAGTNGKGSTVAYISSVLTEAGYKTGRYISPYVIEFRERIEINGKMIPPEKLAKIVTQLKPEIAALEEKKIQITYFEAITAAALCYFAQEQCDVVVVEVGLGGRFDATNVLEKPLVSVITSIGLDHTEVLGSTIEQIAAEKSGIIKDWGTTVCCPDQDPDALGVIFEQCALKNNRLVMGNLAAADVKAESFSGSVVTYGDITLEIPLVGRHQVANCITAVEVLGQLRCQGYAISDKNITNGIKNTRFPARMELVSQKPLLFIDGAHNPPGAAVLAETLKLIPNKPRIAVLGMLADKDVIHTVSVLAPCFDQIITTTPTSPRAMSAQELQEIVNSLEKKAIAEPTPAQALKKAVKLAGCDGTVVVCGSLYLAGELRAEFVSHSSEHI